MNEIKLIAHRGGYKQSNTRENSIEAIKYATSKEYIDGVGFNAIGVKFRVSCYRYNVFINTYRRKTRRPKYKYKFLKPKYL